uniref:Ig-like domain-containing protein n=1 Tax=Callithrix jacchus TaxID=9483 RepID=A0A8I3VZ20_CALJA
RRGQHSLCSWDTAGGPHPHGAPCVPESPTKPQVFPLSLCSEQPDGNVVVACLVRSFFPQEPLSVTWSQSGTTTHFPPSQAAPGGLYTTSSQLTLPAAQCPDTKSVKCSVKHYTYDTQDVAVPCRAIPPLSCRSCCEPRLSLHRPALEDLLLGSEANLTCTLTGLANASGITFTWKPSSGKTAVQGKPERDLCGCYSVSSVLPGCAEPWNRGETFTCTAAYLENNTSLTATITKPGNTFRPQVHLLPPPSEELALNELVTLTCLARGFSPKDVLVRWLQGSQELPQEKYLTWTSQQEPGQDTPTFAVTSVLRVPAEAWNKGDTFSCMVGHEALPLAFTQKTIDRLADWQTLPPCVELDPLQETLEEETPGASLWPTTVTFLTLFLLSLFYSTALTVTSVRGPSSSREGPQF